MPLLLLGLGLLLIVLFCCATLGLLWCVGAVDVATGYAFVLVILEFALVLMLVLGFEVKEEVGLAVIGGDLLLAREEPIVGLDLSRGRGLLAFRRNGGDDTPSVKV